MKTLIMGFLTIFAASALAGGIKGTVEDVYCGEMDPFAVGDACVVFVTVDATGAKLGLVYSDYDWSDRFVYSEVESETDVIGDQFEAQFCEKIGNPNVVSVLRDFNSNYFYLSCAVDGFSWQ